MQTKHSVALALILICIALATTRSEAQSTLYDNFNGKYIDPSKWLGLEQSYVTSTRESVRALTPTPRVSGDKRLQLRQRGYSVITDNTGTSNDSIGLQFADPGNITSVSFTEVAETEQAVGCSGNPAAAGVVAGFEGSFFNPSNVNNQAAGDVKANIVIDQSSSNTGKSLYAYADYYQCLDAGCSSQNSLFSQALGTVAPGSTNTLTLQWNQSNHQFIFQLNNNPPVASTYTISDSFPPGYPLKYLYAGYFLPNCTTTPRPYALVDAYFDDVFVNP